MKQTELLAIIEKMSPKEKVDQLLQLAADFYTDNAEDRTGPMDNLDITETTIDNAGSILGVSGAQKAIDIQKNYIENNPHNLPTILMADIIHGFRTIFPIPLALGCTWNKSAVEEMASISALESSVSGLHLTFSPMLDLVRDPRWGRVLESTGEDPYLNSEYARAMVKGYQGDNLKEDVTKVAACVKHFAAYGGAIGGRDYNTVDVSETTLREKYLPSYHAAIEAGAKIVMTAFNTIEGVPASGNKKLFRDVLRDEFDFKEPVISDWAAIKEMINHGVAANEKDAARLAIEAGVDIEMMTTCYDKHLLELIEEDAKYMDLLDEAVLRILELKNDLGLFENPYRGADPVKEKEVILSQSHRESARKIAEKTMVLLENKDVLPLDKAQKIAVVGPKATTGDLMGAWSWQGKFEEVVTIADGLSAMGSNVTVSTVEYDLFENTSESLKDAKELATTNDVVVLALGEADWMSGEAASRSDIKLPQSQIELFKEVRSVAKKVVVVLINGRPLDLTDISEADGILEAWFPGTEAGNAIANILFGDVNPSGRLSMSFPENVGQVPVYYNTENTGRPYEAAPEEKYVSKYLDISNYARYPFGFGLSYSSVSYDKLELNKEVGNIEDTVKATVTLTNHSDRQVTETIQLYTRDLVGETARPLKELKAFKQIELQANETKEVIVELDTKKLAYVHQDLSWATDAGEFNLMVGPNSRELKLAKSFSLR
ncbi:MULTISPECIES: beta-glucosidase BglX [Vagococcus]|uniref:beta-glucosidase n=1 Tax=Vagococcus fluvialis bH819 TaxID=1255619 RepID=A0A1X6WM56_9ENTE|nr:MULTISPECIES: beta-glucosidase BglX [Vagococcus]SLM84746.1 Beta-glucosidase [Vagococcus fluvialis bH819]HCM89792.1 beta-glucosidase BglX [Vagococcus sp.]